MLILGVNEGRNASVAICRDGIIEFALQEERVARRKEASGFPHQALRFALEHMGLSAGNFDIVALSHLDSPTRSREFILADYETDLTGFASALRSGSPRRIAAKTRRFLERAGWRAPLRGPMLDVVASLAKHGLQDVPFRRFSHHANHAASAYWGLRADPHSAHLVLTLDNGGDGASAEVHVAEEGRLRLVASTAADHSLGHIFSHATYLLGLAPYEDEQKMMALAAYSDPEHCKATLNIFRSYIGLDPRDPLHFKRKIPEATAMAGPRMARDLRRVRFDDLAGAAQALVEELVVEWVQAAVEKTGVKKVLASGALFKNTRMNKKIARLPSLDYFDVFPSCGDETLSFGAAWHASVAQKPALNRTLSFGGPYLGPDAGFDLEDAMKANQGRLHFERLEDPDGRIVALLAEGKVVARCSGRLEFGARALGNRSLLADPKDPRVTSHINKAIKQRDFWVPFSPATPNESVRRYVEIPDSLPQERLSPAMMHCFDTTEERAEFAAGVHPLDGVARMQTVSAAINPAFHGLLTRFGEATGHPVLLNTSFNLSGQPMAMGAKDAMDAMLNSGIEYLVINDVLATKPQA